MRFVSILAAWLVATPLAAAPWLTITEVHYNPPGGDAEEFVEVLSREPPRTELSDWTIAGDIDYRFPPGTVILPKEYLVIARDPESFRKRHPELGRVLGPYARALDNAGGRLALQNAAGAIVAEVRYRTRGKWPRTPDGTGHTLSILDPGLDPGRPESWAASAAIGGTPGAANFVVEDVPTTALVARGATWRFAAGSGVQGAAWRQADFDDSRWSSGPSGLGYGDDDDATVIEDMRGAYLTLLTRHAFTVPDPGALKRLILRVDYDDGFAAYLNGKEIGRANLGEEAEISSDQPAERRREAGAPAEIDLGPAASWLAAGKNVLAVEVHNDDLSSSDLTLIVELLARDDLPGAGRRARPLINEVHAEGPRSFVEITNAGDAPLDLNGYFLLGGPGAATRLRIAGAAPVPPHGLFAVTREHVGDSFRLEGPRVHVALLEPGGRTVVDALRIGDAEKKEKAKKETKGEAPGTKGKPKDKETGKEKEPAKSDSPPGPHGRFPDGAGEICALDRPTPGAPNALALEQDLVLNEIHYRSPTGGATDEFIEIHNRGGRELSLGGFRLAGAVSYPFESGARIPADGYLAIAANPAALATRHGLARTAVLGPYEGGLSGGGEEIVLRDPRGNAVDRVAYADKSPWPRWADGLGSSLELIDPALDNSIAAAWAPSQTQARSKWEAIAYTREQRAFKGTAFSELQLMLLAEGECLIDDIKIAGVLDESFERGGEGWTALGTHERSGVVREAEVAGDGAARGARGGFCLRLVADGRGNARNNYVARELPVELVPGRKYKVSFRARWLRGSPLLLVRTPGQGLAHLHRCDVPEKIGTPAAENSTRSRTAPPAVDVPRQEPVLPLAGQPVTISVRISARGALRSATLHYHSEEAGSGGQTSLVARGAGLYAGQIPGFPSGIVSFYIEAVDADGRTGTFPPGGAERPALYASGLAPSRKLPTYTILVSSRERERLAGRPRMSNHLLDATLVYGDSRIFYNVGLRPRGSPFTRSNRNWRVVFGAENIDGRGTLTLDGQGGDGTRLNERLTYWLADQLRAPNSRQQYVFLRIPGSEEGVFEDVEKIDGSYLERWFGDGAEDSAAAARKLTGLPGLLHKVDDYWELSVSGYQDYIEADFRFLSLDPEDYRWNFPPRASAFTESFEPFIKLVQVLDPRSTPDRGYEEKLEKVVDVDEWLKILAARTIVDDWDTMGRTRGKNAFVYRPPEDERWRLLVWDCDLAWRDPHSPLFLDKFPAIRRLLSRPAYRRRFLGYLGYLAERCFGPERFEAVLQDLQAHSGAQTTGFSEFARQRRRFVLGQVPTRPFQLTEAKRVDRTKSPDVLRASGLGSPLVARLRIAGQEGAARFGADDRFTAEVPIGPEGGELQVEAVDIGGTVLARATVRIRARAAAMALPAVPLPPAAREAGADAREETPATAAPAPGPVAADPTAPLAPPPAAPAPSATPATTPAAPAAAAGEPSPRAELDPATARAIAALTADEGVVQPGEPVRVEPPAAPPSPRDASRSSAVERRRLRPQAAARTDPADRPDSGPAEEDAARGPGPWLIVGVAAAILLTLQAVILAIVRFRRSAARSPSPASRDVPSGRAAPEPEGDPYGPSAELLGDAVAAVATAALRELTAGGLDAVPALLAALDDPRRTPFLKIRRGPGGLTTVPTESSPGIPVRHVAALILETTFGAAPPDRLSRAGWEALRDGARRSS